MTKCQTCLHGSIKEGFCNSIYKFKKAIKADLFGKVKIIDYSIGELGCRESLNNHTEKSCLQNNFSSYIKFER